MKGLSQSDAEINLQKFGKNEVSKKDKFKVPKMILSQFKDPLVILLIIAAGLSYFIGEAIDSVLIIAIVFLNGIVGFFQEYKAERTIESIKKRLKSEVKVFRDGAIQTIDSIFLVPNDILILEAGDKIPADCKIISGDLTVDESMLTGESIPIFKSFNDEIFAGTLIVKGKVEVRINSTGMNTSIGKISELSEGETETPFQEKLRKLSGFLGKVVIGISVLVALIGILEGKEVLEMIELGISLGVAAVPEGLIILSTMCLAVGVKKMADHKAIVKKLPAVEALGSIDVLCVDKTGTVTENKLKVKEKWGDIEIMKIAAALTSQELKDPVDEALRIWAGGRNPESFEPFDSDKKFSRATLKGRMYIKGAPEIVAKQCKNLPDDFETILNDMASRGLKILAFASGVDDTKMEFHGFLGLYDPPRRGVDKVLETAKQMGIKIKMITGDHPETARAIAKQVGITGPVIDLTNIEITEADVVNASVFARVAPEDKLKIVNMLQNQGLIVGMTGDGVNDAPALKKANVGIALGSGTDLAKEAADIVLLDDNLNTIIDAVKEGRSVFLNVRKATQYLLSMNTAEIISITAGMFFGVVLFKPAQLLWMNLVTDSLPALAFAYDTNPSKKKNSQIIDKSLWKKIAAAGSLLGLGSLGTFLKFGKSAALNTMIYTEIGYQPIVRKKYKSKGKFYASAFLLATLVLQLAFTIYGKGFLGLTLPGAELGVVAVSLLALSLV